MTNYNVKGMKPKWINPQKDENPACFISVANQIEQFKLKITFDNGLFASGIIKIDSNSNIGFGNDKISFKIIDIDGIAEPPGTVLESYVEGLSVYPGFSYEFKTGATQSIPKNMYLVVEYDSKNVAEITKVNIFYLFFVPK